MIHNIPYKQPEKNHRPWICFPRMHIHRLIDYFMQYIGSTDVGSEKEKERLQVAERSKVTEGRTMQGDWSLTFHKQSGNN